MKSKLNIVDYHVHTGHQYEFFKTGHNFYLIGADSQKPKWDINDRPLPKNVKLITESEAQRKIFDVAIIRSPINIKRYERHIRLGAKPISVVQTVHPQNIPKFVNHIVWNCEESLIKYGKKHLSSKKHYHIIHGFDPDEFKNLNILKIPRVLTVANVFKTRGAIMGYDMWNYVNENIKVCDLFGHGNEDISSSIKKAENFQELIKLYNSYQVFFNPTIESANPRSRAEAAMCGSAIVSTSFFDVKKYFKHQKNIIFADSPLDAKNEIEKLLKDPEKCSDLAQRAREVAIKHFHIKDYIEKWNNVFENVCR